MLFVMVMVGCAFVSLLFRGAVHLKESWGAYQVGLENWVKWLDMATTSVSGKLNLHHTKSVEAQFKALYNYVLLRLQDAVSMLVNEIVSTVSAGISTLVMVFLYVLFWLWRPLPISGNASALVRNYLVKKTFVSAVYGFGVTLLFLAAGNDLAIFFGMVSFFLNYVPEVGAIISMLVPAPVILLDGRLQSPVPTLCLLTFGQVLLKLGINNILEVKLLEADREMSIHPVWVLLNLNYFGYVWGPMGMLVSVPLLAMVKSAVLSVACDTDDVTAGWAEAALSILEGRPGLRMSKAAMDKRRDTALRQTSPPASEFGKEQEGGLDGSADKGARDSGPLNVPSGLV
jgi:predicted PurR-regulated permease PerM